MIWSHFLFEKPSLINFQKGNERKREFLAAEIGFYLHKEFRAAEIGFIYINRWLCRIIYNTEVEHMAKRFLRASRGRILYVHNILDNIYNAIVEQSVYGKIFCLRASRGRVKYGMIYNTLV